MGIQSQGSLTFFLSLIHSYALWMSGTYANKFQAGLLVISRDNSRGKTKQNLSVRTLSLRNFACIPAVIHSALDCFLPTSSCLFLFTKLKKNIILGTFSPITGFVDVI